jgi:hypothetical protein
MKWPLKIQGRLLSEADVDVIKDFLKKNPEWHRSRLSKELCFHWNWCRPDGQYKDMACREMLRKLEKRSLIKLPAPLRPGPGRLKEIGVVDVDQSQIHCRFHDIKPVRIFDARNLRSDEKTFNYLMKTFHYLGFDRPVGQNMKYLVRDRFGRIVGCMLFGAAAWKTEDRDNWIGWSPDMRERNLNLICNNTRFLILPWVEVPHLASHVLGGCLRRLSSDWQSRYGTSVVLVETFVDMTRFKGTCYKAANWKLVGKTKGRSRQDRYSQMKVPVKDIWLYPLRRDFGNVLLS